LKTSSLYFNSDGISHPINAIVRATLPGRHTRETVLGERESVAMVLLLNAFQWRMHLFKTAVFRIIAAASSGFGRL
jgi:hypothetical protein